jgi:hypothetical protein
MAIQKSLPVLTKSLYSLLDSFSLEEKNKTFPLFFAFFQAFLTFFYNYVDSARKQALKWAKL